MSELYQINGVTYTLADIEKIAINAIKQGENRMTTNTIQPTCAERIGQEMADREEQIKAMTEQAEGSEYYGDEESIYELALSITVEKVATICLSWGGPADYIEITYGEGGISNMIYRYSDWFDTATREIKEGSALWNYGEMMLEGIGE